MHIAFNSVCGGCGECRLTDIDVTVESLFVPSAGPTEAVGLEHSIIQLISRNQGPQSSQKLEMARLVHNRIYMINLKVYELLTNSRSMVYLRLLPHLVRLS
jgi:hypothetical protein